MNLATLKNLIKQYGNITFLELQKRLTGGLYE
ncbi:Bacteriocin [Fusobacterium necrophorum subsp. funduliforme]